MSKQKPLPDLFESTDPCRYQIREIDGAEFLRLASEVEASGGRVETVKVGKRNCDWVVGFRMGMPSPECVFQLPDERNS